VKNDFFKFLLGTKLQSFVSALYRFGFLLIFYQMNNSLFYSSLLIASTIIVSRITLILLIPYLKGRNPIKISIVMNLLIGGVAILAILIYPLWNQKIIGFFVLAVIFSTLEEMDNSFQYAVIPNLVQKEFLFKANSLNAIFANINLIVAPVGSYVFYLMGDLRGFLGAYGIICFLSSGILKSIHFSFDAENNLQKEKKNVHTFYKEWHKTIGIILNNQNILFCIAIGVVINLIFAGISGAVLLKMGEVSSNQVFGQTIIKIALAGGSLVGVFGVLKLKVKENYNKYLNISILGLILNLVFMAFIHIEIMVYIMFFVLAVFIMFIMNATGTFLQLSTPKNELSSIYAFRSTLYAIVVPVSHVIAGAMLQFLDKTYYFLFSVFLLLVIYLLKFLHSDKTSSLKFLL